MFVKSLPNPAWLFLGNVVSHMDFQASVEMGMKNVDKDAVNTTIGLFCYLVTIVATKKLRDFSTT